MAHCIQELVKELFFKNSARVIRHSGTHTHVGKVQNGTDTQNLCIVIKVNGFGL